MQTAGVKGRSRRGPSHLIPVPLQPAYLGTGLFKGGRLIIQRANRNAGANTSTRNANAQNALASAAAHPIFSTTHNSAKYKVPLTTEKSMANSRKAARGLTWGCLTRRT